MKNLIEPQILERFRENPPSNKDLKDFLDANPQLSAAGVCRALGMSLRGFYDWKYRFQQNQSLEKFSSSNQSIVAVAGKGKKYSAEDKLTLVKEYARLEVGSKTEFLRKMGLYQSDIQKWSDAIDAAGIAALSMRKVRKDKRPESEIALESLRRENHSQEKTIAKLAALVVFQKKVSDMLEREE